MDRVAVQQAKERLERAKSAGWVVQNGVDKAAVREAWWTFLLCIGVIYSKLEQGSKGYRKSEAWYGKRKYERKNDELLRYLHQARNSEVHGLDVSGVGRGIDAIEAEGCDIVRDANGEWIGINAHVGAEVSVKIVEPQLVFLPVTDGRSKMKFDPPTMHLGKRIPENIAISAVGLSYKYVEEMIAEAEQLVARE